jgi:hypothetical protein
MDPELAKFLNTTLPVAVGVITGSLPLMGVIGWFAIQQSSRMARIENSLDKLTDSVGGLKETVAVLVDRDKRPEQPRLVQPV